MLRNAPTRLAVQCGQLGTQHEQQPQEKKKMKTTDLFDGRVRTINTRGLDVCGLGFCDLRVDAGFGPEDPDHSRGFVRLELDRETDQCGGVATRVLRAATVRNGQLKDVLEFHTRGDCETDALARALFFAALQLLRGDEAYLRDETDQPASNGVLHDSPYGSVWQEA
jgi:hypothetical protein